MKVIDLLNKIANGEELPKKIIFWEREYILDKEYNCYLHQVAGNKFIDLMDNNNDDTYYFLNDEVEVIEEDKKIEKIDLFDNYIGYNWSRRELCEQLERNFVELNSKINEIIDYLEENKNEN